MSLLHNYRKPSSSQAQISIKEVREGILILPKNRYCAIIETSSINFELKSEEEQDIIIDGFQNFLNSLPCPLQILVRVREVDVEQYLQSLSRNIAGEKEAIYKEQAHYYSEFIQKLISGNKILSRRFYVIISYYSGRTTDFDLVKEQVLLNQDIVIKGFEKMGMKAGSLDSLEILDLFYAFYNPGLSKIQALKTQTLEALLNQTYDI